VKQFSALDSFILNNGILNVLVGTPIAFTIALFLFPGMDLGLSMVVGFLASIPFALMYIQMTAAMPRSGGDYAWVTRTLNPALGFMNSWALVVVSIYGPMISVEYTFSQYFLSTQFGILGALTNNPALTQLGTRMSDPTVSFIVASIILAVMAVITAVGIRAVRLTFYILFAIMIVGVVAIMALFAVTPNSAFAAAFDTYSAGLGTTYQGLIDTAKGAGWVPTYNPIPAAIAALPVTLLMYGGFTYIVYLGGEVKRSDRTLLISIFGTLIIGLVMWAGSGYLLTQAAGYDFLNAGAYLSFSAPQANPMKVPIAYSLFVSILAVGNPALYWTIFAGFVVSYLIFAPSYYLVITRAVFAWSFDRLAPSVIADVNETYHTPIKAIILTFIAGEIACLAWAFQPVVFSWFNTTLAWTALWIIPGISAMVFPFRKRSIYKSSPSIVTKEVAGIPVVSICGLLVVIIFTWALVYGYLNPAFSGPTMPIAIAVTAGIFISGLVYFYVAKAIRKNQGIDLNMIFQSIPPE
jgi:APA family basic amino acid/polyamine antiporter